MQLLEISAFGVEDAEDELEESLVEVDGEARRPLQGQHVDELGTRQIGEMKADRLKRARVLMKLLPKKLKKVGKFKNGWKASVF